MPNYYISVSRVNIGYEARTNANKNLLRDDEWLNNWVINKLSVTPIGDSGSNKEIGFIADPNNQGSYIANPSYPNTALAENIENVRGAALFKLFNRTTNTVDEYLAYTPIISKNDLYKFGSAYLYKAKYKVYVDLDSKQVIYQERENIDISKDTYKINFTMELHVHVNFYSVTLNPFSYQRDIIKFYDGQVYLNGAKADFNHLDDVPPSFPSASYLQTGHNNYIDLTGGIAAEKERDLQLNFNFTATKNGNRISRMNYNASKYITLSKVKFKDFFNKTPHRKCNISIWYSSQDLSIIKVEQSPWS